ncbi:hypothetical protein ASPZODRAFT_131864 [Penicilliopsis zonata CBS 506.65]|uniref:Sm domain-containing protein n=1 Tax=Penicilliopsis zonata CBS 506.65 TaxID=1073090 RepID=A0A1L9SIC6_9EURO|nr:hypothetical protein ASPZODRAFT_131864 [Penicilliopsis zonata CBS 506.65]OJJ46948.1 hypothetical protein ASPZODRAFT_131864 [Penicilliopsis zonata CBS 506.65]
MDASKATRYLESLLGQTLRVHTTDTRMFVGIFKCTDADRNIILASTYEYRFPPPSAVQEAASAADNQSSSFKMNMTSRLIGLVVVPGQHITRIEVEETAEQARFRQKLEK